MNLKELMKTTQTEVELRVPRWKMAVETMLTDGITYGAIITAKALEESLGVGRNTIQFSTEVSLIRQELERHGMYLDGRGTKHESFQVVRAEQNHLVMKSHNSRAKRYLTRAVDLGTATDTSALNEHQRQVHEKTLDIMQKRLVLMNRRKFIE